MSVSKVILNGNTLMDITQDTVTSNKLVDGYTAHGADGQLITGTLDVNTEPSVYFYDYDGTVIKSYTAQEAANLTELPANAAHTGLISQGWNWTLAEIKSFLTSNPTGIVNVGPFYLPSSGNTEIDITLDFFTSVFLTIGVVGTVTIDWGDGSTDTVTGNNWTTTVNTYHHYGVTGNFTISIISSDPVNNSFRFYNSSQSYAGVLKVWQSSDRYKSATNSRKITAIRIGNGCAQFSSQSFSKCYNLQTVTIPSNFVWTNASPAKYTFAGCTSLKFLTISRGADNIGEYFFQDCWSLKAVAIPTGVTSVGQVAFQNCHELKTLTFASELDSIGKNAFEDCYKLRFPVLKLSNQLTSIPQSTFYNCCEMEYIKFSNSITEFGSNAFSGCYNLQIDGALPSNLTSIGSYAFRECLQLSSITIPNTVTEISTYVFLTCYRLTSCTLPNNLTGIPNYLFSNCDSLYNISIPSSVTTIGTGAFQNCTSLYELTIPSSVTSIAASAFSGCVGIFDYHFQSTTPPTLANTNAFSGLPSNADIYVPRGSLTAYQTATNWSTYASQMLEEPA